MLLIDGVKAGTHKGSSMQFGRSYVMTGTFSRKDGILYSQLQTMREKADYQNVFKLEEREGRTLLMEAEDLRTRMKEYIKERLGSIHITFTD